MMHNAHYPVMTKEVLQALAPQDGEVYVDGTFGAGGYTRAFLQSADCTVIAIDRDPSAKVEAEEFAREFGGRFIFIAGCYGDAFELVRAAGYQQVDGFVLDIGVSSMQLDQADRGFSFRFDGPLDMRMEQAGESAADIVNSLPEEELANMIYRFGEERLSRRIARKIVEVRQKQPFATTFDLANCIRQVVPLSPKYKIDPATRTFQALRIAVNDELGELQRGLEAAENLLKDQGRLVVVSFHSLEDGIVKAFLYDKSGYRKQVSRHVPVSLIEETPITFSLSKRKAIEAGEDEIKINPRSRSAKLRTAVRQRQKGENI